jgi:hypothetical protein
MTLNRISCSVLRLGKIHLRQEGRPVIKISTPIQMLGNQKQETVQPPHMSGKEAHCS